MLLLFLMLKAAGAAAMHKLTKCPLSNARILVHSCRILRNFKAPGHLCTRFRNIPDLIFDAPQTTLYIAETSGTHAEAQKTK